MAKRLILMAVSLLITVIAMHAVPARTRPTLVTQPDGTTVTVSLHGDEWLHFTTTSDGYSVVRDSRGYYVYAQLDNGQLVPTTQVAHDATQRSAAEKAFLTNIEKNLVPEMTEEVATTKRRVQTRQQQTLAKRRAAQYDYNNFLGLVILVEFNDKTFSRDDYPSIMDEMLNQEGYTGYYSEDGITKQIFTGSVRDYFDDNSAGMFKPQFDVYGPYTIDYSQYSANGTSNSARLTYEALNAADADINFSQYDRDGDGYVDLVYFIFAGNGANYDGNDDRLYWPHRSVIRNPNNYRTVRKDGVILYDYASSVEMYGWTSNNNSTIDGIGTICHEFSHVLGLPDFYDADYSQSGGESNDPGIWSVMAGGSYENYGRTPVGYSLYERWAVGFADAPVVIDATGSYQLEELAKTNTGYRINSPVNNEYFLFENRQRNGVSKWDVSLPGSGMLVHRVDETNQSVWDNNKVNADPSHNYYEVIRAGGESHSGTAYDLFPGTGNKRELHNSSSPAVLKTWSGENVKWGLYDISHANKIISFNIKDALVLTSLTMDETMSLGVRQTRQLVASPTPASATLNLEWSSDHPEIAEVDAEGNVTGISGGTAVITVESDNGVTASCTVTVIEYPTCNIQEFKQQTANSEVMLELNDAEVLYAYRTRAYVRDANGCLMLYNMGLDIKNNDRITGLVFAKVNVADNMPQAVGVTGMTDASNLIITAGEEVKAREAILGELAAADYSDYVVVRNVQLERETSFYAVSTDARVRVFQKFGTTVATFPADYEGKYYDIYAIWGTDKLSGQIINELYLVKDPIEVEPDGITMLSVEPASHGVASEVYYDLTGRRVDSSSKGLLIRKVLLEDGTERITKVIRNP